MAAIDDTIENLRNSLGITSAQAEDVARSLGRLNTATTRNVFATDAERKATEQLTANLNSLKQSGTQVGTAFNATVSGMSNLSSSITGSGAAFTAVIPILNTMQTVIGSMIASFKALSGGLVGMIPIFGSGLKAISENVAIGIGKSVDIIFGAATAQISATQNLANSFLTLSNSGMIFGGSLITAQKQAAAAGMSLETFASFATKNASALAMLSGNAQTSAINVARISKDLGPGLVSLYGGFENLGSAVADYMAMQTMVGKDAVKDQKSLTEGAKAYLLNQKELSNLTGKDITRLKQEQEARLKTAAYQAKLGEMTVDKAQQTQNAISQITTKYGEQAGQLAMESVARGGDIISESGIKFQAMMPELATAITRILDTAKLSDTEYKTQSAAIFSDTTAIIKNYQTQFKDYLELFASGRGPTDFFKMINDTVAAGIASVSAAANLPKAQAEASASTKAAMDKLPDLVDTTIIQLEKFKVDMNELTIKYLPITAQAIDAAFKVAELFAQSLEKLADVTSFILGDMTAAELARSLGLSESGTTPAPLTPEERTGIEERRRRRGQPIVPYDPRYDPNSPLFEGPATTPAPAAPAAPPNPPVPVSQANPLLDESRERTAALQSEIERLDRELVAMRNTPPPVNGEQTVILTAIRTVLEDSSNKLTGIKDALA